MGPRRAGQAHGVRQAILAHIPVEAGTLLHDPPADVVRQIKKRGCTLIGLISTFGPCLSRILRCQSDCWLGKGKSAANPPHLLIVVGAEGLPPKRGFIFMQRGGGPTAWEGASDTGRRVSGGQPGDESA